MCARAHTRIHSWDVPRESEKQMAQLIATNIAIYILVFAPYKVAMELIKT